jgi:predicted amidophosphoribosyltransferase
MSDPQQRKCCICERVMLSVREKNATCDSCAHEMQSRYRIPRGCYRNGHPIWVDFAEFHRNNSTYHGENHFA